MSARKKNRPALPELGVSELLGGQESQSGQLEGEKSEESSEQFSPEDIAALAQAAHAIAFPAEKLRRNHRLVFNRDALLRWLSTPGSPFVFFKQFQRNLPRAFTSPNKPKPTSARS